MQIPAQKILRIEILLAGLIIVTTALSFIPIPTQLISVGAHSTMLDFVAYHSAALIFTTTPAEIYNHSMLQQTQSGLAGTPLNTILPYLYPPYSLLYYLPTAHLPMPDAYFLWRLVNTAATILLILILYIEIAPKRIGIFCFASLLTIISVPWLESLYLGQPVLLMVIGLLAFHLLLKYQCIFLACFILLLTSFKPQLTIGPALYLFIINYNRKLLLYSLFIGFIVFVTCSAIFGLTIWQSYIHTLLSAPEKIHTLSNVEFSMGNIKSLALLIFGREHSPTINFTSLIIWLASLLFTAYGAFYARHKSEPTTNLIFSLVIIISCVFGPWSHISSLILLAIPLAYLFKYGNKIQCHIITTAIMITSLLFFTHNDIKPTVFTLFQLLLLTFICRLIYSNNKKAHV